MHHLRLRRSQWFKRGSGRAVHSENPDETAAA